MMSVTLPSLSIAASPASPSRTVLTSTTRSPCLTTVMLRLNRTGNGPGIFIPPVTKYSPGNTSLISPCAGAEGNGRGVCVIVGDSNPYCAEMAKAHFEAELVEGHKGVTVVIVPFSPEDVWLTKPIRLDRRRHGWLVTGTANGTRFDGYIGERWGRFFII